MKGYYGSSCHARIRTCTCAQHARRVLSKGIIHNVMTGLNVEYTKLAAACPESDESEWYITLVFCAEHDCHGLTPRSPCIVHANFSSCLQRHAFISLHALHPDSGLNSNMVNFRGRVIGIIQHDSTRFCFRGKARTLCVLNKVLRIYICVQSKSSRGWYRSCLVTTVWISLVSLHAAEAAWPSPFTVSWWILKYAEWPASTRDKSVNIIPRLCLTRFAYALGCRFTGSCSLAALMMCKQ